MDGAKLFAVHPAGSSGAGLSAVAICVVIGGNARKPGVWPFDGRAQICLQASLRRQQIATAAIRSPSGDDFRKRVQPVYPRMNPASSADGSAIVST